MKTTIIVDGNNLAYRNAAAMTLSTKDGFNTGGIFGTLKCLSAYSSTEIKEVSGREVSECIVVFDGGRSKRRTSLYPEYKGGRKTDADRTEEEKKFYHDFLEQANILFDQLPILGIKTIKAKGWEADDIIYGIIKMSETERKDEENHFIIISTDEDFLQLISENTSVYSPIKKLYYTYENFYDMFGCKPEHFISYKILKGDSSDNITGIHGIGEKTGKKLVNEYGGLTEILSPANRMSLMKSRVTQRIFTPEGLQTIDRNNRLINIKEFVDYTEVEDLIIDTLNELPQVDSKEAKKFLMKYQLSSILVKFNEWIKTFKDLCEKYYEES